MKEYRL